MASDDVLVNGEHGVFLAPVVEDMAKAIIDGHLQEVFVVTADNDEDWHNEVNLHKKVAMIPWWRYNELLEAAGWRVEAEPQRPPDISHSEYQKLSEEDKQARIDQFNAYADLFDGPGKPPYPQREQNGHQKYADSQRARGYGPPGIYC